MEIRGQSREEGCFVAITNLSLSMHSHISFYITNNHSIAQYVQYVPKKKQSNIHMYVCVCVYVCVSNQNVQWIYITIFGISILISTPIY